MQFFLSQYILNDFLYFHHMHGTGQFCHGYAWGPWTAVAWWALYWNGPIRQTVLMVSGQIPTWNDARKKVPWLWKTIGEYWQIVKQFAVFERKQLLNVVWIFCAESSDTPCRRKRFPVSRQNVQHSQRGYRCFCVWIFSRNVCRPWPVVFSRRSTCHSRDEFCWFRAKTSVFRDKIFAVLAPEKKFWSAILFQCYPHKLLSKRVTCFFFSCTKYFTFSVVSLPLIRNTISKNVHGNRGAILTTHSMEEADALCSRVGIMVKGQLKWVAILNIIEECS